MGEFAIQLKKLCDANGYALEDGMLAGMQAYYERMLEYNKTHNITRITGEAQAARDHFFDSIVPMRYIPQGGCVVDVGSGAGFPIVPLKIIRPDISATAVESAEKKCRFIKEACAQGGLDVAVRCERAETLGVGDLRESFDVCVSRAVSQLRILLELCVPLVKPGGLLIAYKGDCVQELAQAQSALDALDAAVEQVFPYPGGHIDHNYLLIRKNGRTKAKYPRSYATIKKKSTVIRNLR